MVAELFSARRQGLSVEAINASKRLRRPRSILLNLSVANSMSQSILAISALKLENSAVFDLCGTFVAGGGMQRH